MQLRFGVVGVTLTFSFHLSCSNVFCMLLVTSSRTSSIMAEKIEMPDLLHFPHFTSIILPCGCNNFKSFSCILLKFVMYVTNDQLSTSSVMAGGYCRVCTCSFLLCSLQNDSMADLSIGCTVALCLSCGRQNILPGKKYYACFEWLYLIIQLTRPHVA